jgi:hypothetical protein
MTLGNMRELGVQRLIAYCLNDACRHQALIDVSSYPADTEVPSFGQARSAASVAGSASTCGRTGKSSAGASPRSALHPTATE